MEWWIYDEEKDEVLDQPFTKDELSKYGDLTSDTLVQPEDEDEWYSASEVPELKGLFSENNKPEPPSRKAVDSNKSKCPQCGSYFEKQENRCPNCKHPIGKESNDSKDRQSEKSNYDSSNLENGNATSAEEGSVFNQVTNDIPVWNHECRDNEEKIESFEAWKINEMNGIEKGEITLTNRRLIFHPTFGLKISTFGMRKMRISIPIHLIKALEADKEARPSSVDSMMWGDRSVIKIGLSDEIFKFELDSPEELIDKIREIINQTEQTEDKIEADVSGDQSKFHQEDLLKNEISDSFISKTDQPDKQKIFDFFRQKLEERFRQNGISKDSLPIITKENSPHFISYENEDGGTIKTKISFDGDEINFKSKIKEIYQTRNPEEIKEQSYPKGLIIPGLALFFGGFLHPLAAWIAMPIGLIMIIGAIAMRSDYFQAKMEKTSDANANAPSQLTKEPIWDLEKSTREAIEEVKKRFSW